MKIVTQMLLAAMTKLVFATAIADRAALAPRAALVKTLLLRATRQTEGASKGSRMRH